jgi:hypothetical protein
MAITHALAGMPQFREETTLALLIFLGGAIYAAAVLLSLGRNWLHDLLRDVGGAADTVSPLKPGPSLSDQAGKAADEVTKETSPSREDLLESV